MSKANSKSQFNIKFNPMIDDLDIIILLGYAKLNSTVKNIWLTIAKLFRSGEKSITVKKLAQLLGVHERTIKNALVVLAFNKLIIIKSGKIIPLPPNAREKTFRAAITMLDKWTKK